MAKNSQKQSVGSQDGYKGTSAPAPVIPMTGKAMSSLPPLPPGEQKSKKA